MGGFQPMSSLQILDYSQIFRIWLFKLFLWTPRLLLLMCTPGSFQTRLGFLGTKQTWEGTAGPELLLSHPHFVLHGKGMEHKGQNRFLLEMPFVFAKQFSLRQGGTNFQVF